MQQQAERVVIGMDPHKRSATIEVMTADETVVGTRAQVPARVAPDAPDAEHSAGVIRSWQPFACRSPCQGTHHRLDTTTGTRTLIGPMTPDHHDPTLHTVYSSHIAMRLLAAGEQVLDVPPKLSARARVFATGQGRKTDATDAHSVALVAPGWPGCGRS